MPPDPRYTGFKHHARVQTFRFITMLLAWALLIVTFIYKPEWIRDGTRAIESVGDSLPSYWCAQAEIILRELGGFLWIQITAVIVAIRTIFWLLGVAFRRRGFGVLSLD